MIFLMMSGGQNNQQKAPPFKTGMSAFKCALQFVISGLKISEAVIAECNDFLE
jgi:hypothetical protein